MIGDADVCGVQRVTTVIAESNNSNYNKSREKREESREYSNSISSSS